MIHPELHDRVRLTEGVPNLWLERGDIGVVESIWHATTDYCEVEFNKPSEPFRVRALVPVERLEVVESTDNRRE